MAGQIDRAGEGEGGSRALQQPAGLGAARGAETEQHGADGGDQMPDRNDVFGAEPIEAAPATIANVE